MIYRKNKKALVINQSLSVVWGGIEPVILNFFTEIIRICFTTTTAYPTLTMPNQD